MGAVVLPPLQGGVARRGFVPGAVPLAIFLLPCGQVRERAAPCGEERMEVARPSARCLRPQRHPGTRHYEGAKPRRRHEPQAEVLQTEIYERVARAFMTGGMPGPRCHAQRSTLNALRRLFEG